MFFIKMIQENLTQICSVVVPCSVVATVASMKTFDQRPYPLLATNHVSPTLLQS